MWRASQECVLLPIMQSKNSCSFMSKTKSPTSSENKTMDYTYYLDMKEHTNNYNTSSVISYLPSKNLSLLSTVESNESVYKKIQIVRAEKSQKITTIDGLAWHRSI